MNQDSISEHSNQSSRHATTPRSRATDSAPPTLRGRVEQFFGRLHARYAQVRDRAFAAMDEDSPGQRACAAALDPDRFADENLDSDYGSSPRVGMDNLAATPVADPYLKLIEAVLGRFGRGIGNQLKQHPAVSLIAAASVGFVAARWATRPRRDV